MGKPFVRRVGWLAVFSVVAVFLGFAPNPAAADIQIQLAHTPPVTAAAGNDLRLDTIVNCLSCTNVDLIVHYTTPDGSLSAATMDVNGQAGYFTNRPLSVTVPGTDVRYSHFHYWLEVFGHPKLCNDIGCTGHDRFPAAGTVDLNTALHFAVELYDAAGQEPLRSTAWEIYYMPSAPPDTAPSPALLASGRTGANGLVNLDLPIDSGVIQAAADARAGGIVNITLQTICVWILDPQATNGSHTCVDPSSTTPRGGTDTVLAGTWSTYVNVSATRRDAVTAGLGGMENLPQTKRVNAVEYNPDGQFNPLDTTNGECDIENPCPEPPAALLACEQEGYYLEGWTWKRANVAEVHMDWGGEAGFQSKNGVDSTWTVGFKAGDGSPWAAGAGYSNVSGTHITETQHTVPGQMGHQVTRTFFSTANYYGLYTSAATYYKNGDISRPYCNKVHWVHALSRNEGQGMALNYSASDTDTATGAYGDRCWTYCTVPGGTIRYFQPGNSNGGPQVATFKADYTRASVSLWGFFEGSYSAGQSTEATRQYFMGPSYGGSCTGGWTLYFDGLRNPVSQPGAPNLFVDAGAPGGDGVYNSAGEWKPEGCW